MPKKIDLTGQTFGRLYVIQRSDNPPKPDCVYWDCRCNCGKNTQVNTSRLVRGLTQSCGCGMGSKPRDPNLVAEWVKLYQEGYNTVQIGEMYGKSHVHIFQAIQGQVEFRAKGNQGIVRLKQVDEWVAQYKFGLTIDQIAKRSNRSKVAICNALKKQGFNLVEAYSDRLENKRFKQAEIMLEIYKKGYSQEEVAQVFDVSSSWVQSLLSEFFEDQLRTKPQATRLGIKKRSALTNNSRAINLATDRHDLKPITHKTKDLRWGQDNYDINRREHIL